MSDAKVIPIAEDKAFKVIGPIDVDGKKVLVEIRRLPVIPGRPHAVKLTARCGNMVREGTHTFDPTKTNRTKEDIEKELTARSGRLACECVGHKSTGDSLDEYFSQS